MALAERAQLVTELSLDDKMAAGLRRAGRNVTAFETRANRMGRGFRTLGAGIGTAISNGVVIGIAALGGLATAVGVMVKEGQEAAKVETIYATAIANSGKVSRSYVGVLNAQQKALMQLAGVDDELIKTEQTRLIQMGLTGEQIAKLTPLILDASKATGKDLLAVTLAVGKAVNGNVAGLQRYGIVIDKTKAKVDPFGAVVDALNKKFGGTTQALSGTLEARLGAFREGLANIREEAGQKLLPSLTRIVDVLGTAVVPAFAKFVDRIMPGVTTAIEDIAKALEGGGAERAIGGITDALGTMIDLLKLAAEPVKAIVGAFLKLPKEVQTVLIAGFAVNKLSGGLIGQGIGQIAGGFLQRGGSPANPLWVADVTGGGAGGILGKGGGLLATLTSLPVLIGAAVVAGVSALTWEGVVMPRLQAQAGGNIGATEGLIQTGSLADLEQALRGLRDMPDQLDPLKKALYDLNVSGVKVHTETLAAAIEAEIRKRTEIPGAAGKINPATGFSLVGEAAAVYERAVAKGLGPDFDDVQHTLDRNAERAAAAVTLAGRATQLLQAFANIQLAAIAAKDMSPQITIPVQVTSTVSVRNGQVEQRVSASYNTGRRTVGGLVMT